MPVLVIGEAQRRLIAELKAFAAANPQDAISAKTVADRDMAAYRDMMSTLTLELPVGFVVTYTHEMQPKAGLCHHISISVRRPKKVPHPEAVQMILNEFGMRPLDDAPGGVWVEEIDPVTKAINVVQPVSS
jgi:hypothetical protein